MRINASVKKELLAKDAEIAEWKQCAQTEACLRKEAHVRISKLRETLQYYSDLGLPLARIALAKDEK